jgi:hypothetical protein
VVLSFVPHRASSEETPDPARKPRRAPGGPPSTRLVASFSGPHARVSWAWAQVIIEDEPSSGKLLRGAVRDPQCGEKKRKERARPTVSHTNRYSSLGRSIGQSSSH